jgi:hypothetical protein
MHDGARSRQREANTMSDVLRTPEERFADLPGYPFAPHFVSDLEGYPRLRVHFLDEAATLDLKCTAVHKWR